VAASLLIYFKNLLLSPIILSTHTIIHTVHTPLQQYASLLEHLLVDSQGSSPSYSWLTEVGPSLPHELPILSGVVTDVSVVTTPDETWPMMCNKV